MANAKSTTGRRGAPKPRVAAPPRWHKNVFGPSPYPPIDPERLRAKARDELLRMLVETDSSDRPFLLPDAAITEVIEDHDAVEPPEYRFARCLLVGGAVGVAAALGLKWNHVLAGLMQLANGARLPTYEKLAEMLGTAGRKRGAR